MKTIIAGSRSITNYTFIEQSLMQFESRVGGITEVVSGGARGVDTLGEKYANRHDIPIRRFIPDWDQYGKRAGIIRNAEMGDYADALVAFWDGESKGTKYMIDYARRKGLVVEVITILPTPEKSRKYISIGGEL